VRLDVILGSLVAVLVAFFIVVACAATLHKSGITEIVSGADAAKALAPLAGAAAKYLFAFGLAVASLFAACILPLSTAYSVCEGLGFESGVNRSFRDAPVFYWLYTLLIVVGAGVVLIPGFPLIRMILFSQVVNGVLLPLILVFMIRLINRSELMGDWVNSKTYNVIAWSAVVILVAMAVALMGLTVRDLWFAT
jgi:Mn2+/Fe2+ NRAMP family transporter